MKDRLASESSLLPRFILLFYRLLGLLLSCNELLLGHRFYGLEHSVDPLIRLEASRVGKFITCRTWLPRRGRSVRSNDFMAHRVVHSMVSCVKWCPNNDH